MKIDMIKIKVDNCEIDLRKLYDLAMNNNIQKIDDDVIDQVKKLNQIYILSLDILKNIEPLIISRSYEKKCITENEARGYNKINRNLYTDFYTG